MNEPLTLREHAETLCRLLETYEPGSFVSLFRELEWIATYWAGKRTTAKGTTSSGTPIPHECMCEVCGKTMVEKPHYDFDAFTKNPEAEIRSHLAAACSLMQSPEPGLGSWVMMFGREMDWLSNYWSGKMDKDALKALESESPAHECPFAFQPNKTVVEKFLIQIETPETNDYCGCRGCSAGRLLVWRAIIKSTVSGRINSVRPFDSAHKVSVQAEQ